MFIRLALLNLRRHRRRTLLIMFSVAMSVMVMELVAGMFEGFRDGFFRNLSDEGGHVVLNARGWEERTDPWSVEYRLPEREELAALLETVPGTADAEAVIGFGALLIAGEEHMTVNGFGIDPEGSLYRNVRDGMIAGDFLSGDQDVVAGRELARLLDLEPGSRVQILVEDTTGSPYYLEFTVKGIFRTGSRSFDGSHLFLSHRAAEELLYMEGETVSVRVRLDDPEGADSWREEAGTVMMRNGMDSGAFLIRTWRETQGSIASLLGMLDAMILFIDLLVVIVVASVITNAILMNVFERIGEFGSMRAMGLRRSGLLRMVLAEGLVQGAAGSIAGLAVTVPVVLYLTAHGVDWGDLSAMFGTGTSLWYFGYDPVHTVANFAAGTAIAVAGSLYAAVTAARMPVLENLKQV